MAGKRHNGKKSQKNSRKISKKNGGSSPTPNSPEKRDLSEVMNEVFSIHLIRREIVGHVIQNEIKRGFCRKDLRSVRLVAKSWLEDASYHLLKLGEPLYRIILTPKNSLNSSPGVQESGGKLLDQFTSAMTSSTRLESKIPPFALVIHPAFFVEENHQSFSNFLAGCSSGLVQLQIYIPKTGGSMTFLFPGVNLTFPILHHFLLAFHDPLERASREGEEPPPVPLWSNLVALPFIQSILSGSPKLKALSVPWVAGGKSRAPPESRYLTLPPTLVYLDLTQCPSQLELLPNYDLPHLRHLDFSISRQPDEDQLVIQILEKFKESLESLRMFPTREYFDPTPYSTLIRFPRMEKLRRLEVVKGPFAELEDGHESLGTLLPNLAELLVHQRTQPRMQKWIKSSTFPNVTKLVLHPITDITRLCALNLGTKFPKLEDLHVSLHLGGTQITETGVLFRTFVEMTHLQHLFVDISGGLEKAAGGHWDSLLTGIPLEKVNEVRNNPRRLGRIPRSPHNIMKLKELKTLALRSPQTATGQSGESLISDLAFQFAFLQMPNLKRLQFQGGFKASAEMARVWRERGGILEEK